MKKIFLLLVLLLIPMVVGDIEKKIYFDTPVEIEFIDGGNNVIFEIIGDWDPEKGKPIYKYKIEYDPNSTNLNILKLNTSIGEFYSLNKTTDNIIVALELTAGENPDVVIDTCTKYLDNITQTSEWFHNSYRLCIDQRNTFELQIVNDMVNMTHHNEITNNLTIERDTFESSYETLQKNKETEVATLQERIVELKRHRQYGWVIGIAGLGTSLYLLNKYKGLGKRKQQVETEFPRDVAV